MSFPKAVGAAISRDRKRRERIQRSHELALARIAAGGRTPGPKFLRGLRARIKAGGPQGSAADRDQLSFNAPPSKKKKDDDEGGG